MDYSGNLIQKVLKLKLNYFSEILENIFLIYFNENMFRLKSFTIFSTQIYKGFLIIP